MRTMRCPGCPGELEKLQPQRGLVVETCPLCGGVFFDQDELKVPLQETEPAPSPRACPKCSIPMTSKRYYDGALTLDQCPACLGFWFKAGDVQALRRASKTEDVSGPAKPPPPLKSLERALFSDSPDNGEELIDGLADLADWAADAATDGG